MPNQHTAKLLVTSTVAQCCSCKQIKPHSEFHKDKNIKRFNCAYNCKVCATTSAKKHHAKRMLEEPAYALSKKNNYYKTRYGLTFEQYTKKLKLQKYCAICLTKLIAGDPNVHLDHNHKTGAIREFLCTNCNRGLGHFHEDINKMKSGISYLKKHGDGYGS